MIRIPSPVLPRNFPTKDAAQAKFNGSLLVSLSNYLENLATRANGCLPKDGSETFNAAVDLGAFGITAATADFGSIGAVTPGSGVFTTIAIASGAIIPGTWTPSFTNIANVAAFVAHVGMYIRVGNMVIAGFQVEVDPTLAAPTATSYRFSLPIATNFGATDQASGGSFSRINGPGQVASIAATDDISILFNAANVANDTHTVVFIYRII